VLPLIYRDHPQLYIKAILARNTVNDKSFEGEKFRGLLGSSGMRGKVLQFFHHHLHTFMVFQLYKTAMSDSMKASHSSREFSLKLSLAYLEMWRNGREYIKYDWDIY